MFYRQLFLTLASAVLLVVFSCSALAQGFKQELEAPEKVELTVRNLDGRVSVISSAEQQKKVTIDARSAGDAIAPDDVKVEAKGAHITIDVRPRGEKNRIDIVVTIPVRSKVEVEGNAGAVDVIGNVESAVVKTDTGTIHADVPLDALKFEFVWEASRPRYMSDVELPPVEEKSGGKYKLSGRLPDKEKGDKEEDVDKEAKKEREKERKEQQIALNFRTQRGVVLLNIDPEMAPADLRERPLTEAARAIVRSGDSQLVEAIRKVAPKMFGDYAKTLPPPDKEPELLRRTAPGHIVSSVAPQLLRFNASVTDRNGRAISGMRESDFTVWENGVERRVTNVAPANEPFNLVLLLDVSGSVQERMDFIRKAARDFLRTASPQDRISIIGFRDDIQVISDFSTDRQMLSRKLDEIDAGGGTALYDALGYVLSEPLRRLRGERTAIVVMSDGDDNKSFLPFPAILEALSESGALVYPLYVPSGLVPESSVPKPEITIDPLRTRYLTLTTRAEDEARKIAQASGGIYYPIRRSEDLQKAYDDVVAQLRSAYTITYASNAVSTTPRVRVRTNRDGASVRLSPVVGLNTP
ncbi:MAG: VWA domain-containing protein [Acidobacteria bacterium]|nr:VWA domain-containing protein [Acidobacteriota bacterium]MCA1627749.1 VWA domain-containing protein [Acidobacteriota bacterium]